MSGAPESGRKVSRRDRARRTTFAEIHAAARRLLVTRGSSAVTINAVAREIGMSGPALYHYYASHDALVDAVTSEFYGELTRTMEQARDAVSGAPLGERLLATCRAMRQWATANPAEFEWVFARPVAARNRQPHSERRQAGQRFEWIFLDLLVELWDSHRFPVPDLADLPESLRDQLSDYSAALDHRLPPEAAYVFLSGWTRLYGLLCMEVLHQLDFALPDPEPLYELYLRELFAELGLTPGPHRDVPRESEPSRTGSATT